MSDRLRFSIRSLLMLIALAALSLTVVVQYQRYDAAEMRHRAEVATLRQKLDAAQQVLEALPVEDPRRAYVLATPSFAYARWAWRVYLPPASRYALRVNIGSVVEKGDAQSISAVRGHSQHMGIQGAGETVVVVERIVNNGQQLLGVAIGNQDICPRLTPEVARCLANRDPCHEQQLGTSAAVEIASGDRIDLLIRWYPQADASATSGPLSAGPVGFSVWLEPM